MDKTRTSCQVGSLVHVELFKGKSVGFELFIWAMYACCVVWTEIELLSPLLSSFAYMHLEIFGQVKLDLLSWFTLCNMLSFRLSWGYLLE